MRRFAPVVALAGFLLLPAHEFVGAQNSAPREFDVASIKRNVEPLESGAGTRRLPDGTFMMRNQPIMTVLGAVAEEPILLSHYVGVPDWAKSDRFDVTVKPPAGATPEQIREMWKTLFETRMKYAAHVERREANVYTLVVARGDGRLGPELRKSTLDCGAPPTGGPPLPGPAAPSDMLQRCGMMTSGTQMISGGVTMDMLARNFSGRAGGPVENRTGLDGFYTFTLKFAPPQQLGADAPPADAPDFFTAVEEQLGLKLKTDKGSVPYLIIDHIERPTEN